MDVYYYICVVTVGGAADEDRHSLINMVYLTVFIWLFTIKEKRGAIARYLYSKYASNKCVYFHVSSYLHECVLSH